MAARGRPLLVVSDNGMELTSMAILGWCQQHDVDWHYIAPGELHPVSLDTHLSQERPER